jgi:hypothetical protein
MSFAGKKICFVDFGPWSSEKLTAKDFGIDLMKRVTRFLAEWSSEDIRESAFLSCDIGWWLQIDRAHELIGEKICAKSPADIDKYLEIYSATPFVMTVPLPIDTVQNIAQLERTPNDVTLRASISNSMCNMAPSTSNYILNCLLQSFLLLRNSKIPFGFVRSSIDYSIALYVAGANAQFIGATLPVQHSDAVFMRGPNRSSIVEALVLNLGARCAWLPSRAAEISQVHGRLFCVYLAMRNSIFFYWKNCIDAQGGVSSLLSMPPNVVPIEYWQSVRQSIAQLPSALHDAYFSCVLAVMSKRVDKNKIDATQKNGKSLITCQYDSAAILRILIANR